MVFDPTGRLIGARHVTGTMLPMDIGKEVTWGDAFWPAPVFLPDGHGFAFWKNGLAELTGTLPAR